MKHLASPAFWEAYRRLPEQVRALADKNHALLKANPQHPSLQFKKVGHFRSVRVGQRLSPHPSPRARGEGAERRAAIHRFPSPHSRKRMAGRGQGWGAAFCLLVLSVLLAFRWNERAQRGDKAG
jgi:hypothetical protein